MQAQIRDAKANGDHSIAIASCQRHPTLHSGDGKLCEVPARDHFIGMENIVRHHNTAPHNRWALCNAVQDKCALYVVGISSGFEGLHGWEEDLK